MSAEKSKQTFNTKFVIRHPVEYEMNERKRKQEKNRQKKFMIRQCAIRENMSLAS